MQTIDNNEFRINYDVINERLDFKPDRAAPIFVAAAITIVAVISSFAIYLFG